MAAGVAFFDPGFQGDETAALRRVMDGFLSPTPLARAAFAWQERMNSGAAQLLALAGGYDTAGYDSGLPVFELDRPEVLEGMTKRCGLRLRAWLTQQDIQARFFDPYNAEAPDFPMLAPPDVAYCVLERV